MVISIKSKEGMEDERSMEKNIMDGEKKVEKKNKKRRKNNNLLNFDG